MRLVAKVPDSEAKEIKWLIIEKDKHGTSGYFLFHHKRLEEPCLYDNWFENVDYAFEAAEINYRIKRKIGLLRRCRNVHRRWLRKKL